MERSTDNTTRPHHERDRAVNTMPPNTVTHRRDGRDGRDATVEHLSTKMREIQSAETPESASSLENLPAELRDQVLMSVPDLPTLRSLIRASPVMHAQYRHNRDRILRACLGRELDGFLVDAYACATSRVRALGGPFPRFRSDEKITEFLDAYRGWLSGSTPSINSLELDCLRWLAAFHLSVARPVARWYSTWALANLAQATLPADWAPAESTETAREKHRTLSRSEEIRIFRALYRYETFYHLFGQNKGNRCGGFCNYQINEIFFVLFDPWEVEAVGCLDLFVRQRYKDIFKKVSEWVLHAHNPRFRQPNGVYARAGLFDFDYYMDGAVSRGLKMTVRLLAVDNVQTLVDRLQCCLSLAYRPYRYDAPMRDVLGSLAQIVTLRFLAQPVRRDESLNTRDEAVPPDGPPLGWELLWNGTDVNIYGEFVPLTVRQWGYVMWDERRWMELGPDWKDLMARQWEREPELVEGVEDLYRHWRPSGCSSTAAAD